MAVYISDHWRIRPSEIECRVISASLYLIAIYIYIYNLHKNSQTVKKGAAHAKKAA